MMKTILGMVAAIAAAQAFAGGARLSPVADAEVGTCANGVTVFDDRPFEMTAAAAERLAGKTFFRRTIEGGFAAEVTGGGELFVRALGDFRRRLSGLHRHVGLAHR